MSGHLRPLESGKFCGCGHDRGRHIDLLQANDGCCAAPGCYCETFVPAAEMSPSRVEPSDVVLG